MVLTTVPTTALTVYATEGVEDAADTNAVKSEKAEKQEVDSALITAAEKAKAETAPTSTSAPVETTATQDPVVMTPGTTETLESQKAAAKATVKEYQAFLDEINLEEMGVPADAISAVTEKLNAIKEEVNGALTAIENAENADEVEAAKQTAAGAMAKLETLSSDSEGTPDTLEEVAPQVEEAEKQEYTVTVEGYRELVDNRMLSFAAPTKSQDGTDMPTDFDENGTFTYMSSETDPFVTFDITLGTGYTVDTDKSMGEGVTYSAPTVTVHGNATVTISVKKGFSVSLDDGASTHFDEAKLLVETGEYNTDGSAKTKTVVDGTPQSLDNRNEALNFKVTDATIGTDERMKAYYVADGSDDEDATEIPLEITGSGVSQTIKGSVGEGVISGLDSGIKIMLRKETRHAIQFNKVTGAPADATLTVERWDPEAKDAENPEGKWVAHGNNIKAFYGEEIKFRAKVDEDKYVIKSIKAMSSDETTTYGEIAVNESAEYEYTYTIPKELFDSNELATSTNSGDGKIFFEIDKNPNPEKTATFAFGLEGDEGSATAEIISVNIDGTDKEVATSGDQAAINAALGVTIAANKLEIPLTTAENAPLRVFIGETVKSIKVRITPEDTKGYELTDGTSGALVTSQVYYDVVYAKTPTSGQESLSGDMVVRAVTQAKAAGNEKTLTVTVKADDNIGGKHSSDFLTDIAVPDQDDVTSTVTDGNRVITAAATVRNVSFTVKAAKGYKVKDASQGLTNAKVVATGAPAADGSQIYTVIMNADQIKGGTTGSDSGATDALTVILEAVANDLTATVGKTGETNNSQYTVGYKTKAPTQGAEWASSYTSINVAGGVPATASPITFASGFRASIRPVAGYHLTEVSYTIGDGAAVSVPVEWNERLTWDGTSAVTSAHGGYEAFIDIAELTGNIQINVKTEKDDYVLQSLKKVTLGSPNAWADDADQPEKDSDGIYPVDSDGVYAVNVKSENASIPAKDISVVLKDESGPIALTTKVIALTDVELNNNKVRIFDLSTRNVVGKDLTAEVYVTGREEPVGVYKMLVGKKATKISVNNGNPIKLHVGSTQKFPIETDGVQLTNADWAVDALAGADNTGIAAKLAVSIVNGELVVKANPAKRSDIMYSKSEKDEDTGKNVTNWYNKTAVITLTDPDNARIKTTVNVTVDPLFDEDAMPVVSQGVSADTVLGVEVSMPDGLVLPEDDDAGQLVYEITAVAKTISGATRNSKLLASVPLVTVPVTSAGVQKVQIPVTSNLQIGDLIATGEDTTWTYNVKATLKYAAASAASKTTNPAVECSTVGGQKFTDTLKLTKLKGAPNTLYTGQSGSIAMATVEFTKKFASYEIAEARVTDSVVNGGIDAEVVDNTLFITDVDPGAKLGKHTLTVIAKADQSGLGKENGLEHTMYEARATLTVTVAQGINDGDFRISLSTDQIYKMPGKAGSLTATAETWDYKKDKWVKAKAKSIEWRIVNESSVNNNKNSIKDAPVYLKVNDSKYGVSINKSGKLTVARDFVTDTRRASNNRFKVMAKAVDFQGNETYLVSPVVTITSEPINVTTLVVAENLNDNIYSTSYKVLAAKSVTDKGVISIDAEKADGSYVFALTGSVGQNATITQERLNKLRAPQGAVSITSKSNTVSITKAGKLNVKAAGKKASIRVAVNDGTKKNYTLNLDLKYTEEIRDLALSIKDEKVTEKAFDPTKSIDAKKAAKAAQTPVDVKINSTGAVMLDLELFAGNKNGGASNVFSKTNAQDANLVNFRNYKISVKGGKLLGEDKTRGEATVATTANVTTISLTDQTKGASKTTYVYNILNDAYVGKANAPKVKVTGSLYERGGDGEQAKLRLNVLDAKGGRFTNKTVKVEIDWTSYDYKGALAEKKNSNWWTLDNLKAALDRESKSSGVFTFENVNSDDVVLNLYNDYAYRPGTYKLKVTVGKNQGAAFQAETLPATVSIKVAKEKKFSFKPFTTYTINKYDGGAVLGGKSTTTGSEKTYTKFSKLQNANIKGRSNKFTHYFRIETNAVTQTQTLVLNDKDPIVKAMLYETDANGKLTNKKLANPVINIPKEDLTGYISYEAMPSVYFKDAGPNAYGKDDRCSVKGSVKITVKIAAPKSNKASQKYEAAAVQIGTTKTAKQNVNVTVNGYIVDVAYAMIDSSKKNNASQIMINPITTSYNGVNAGGQIELRGNGTAEAGKTYTTNVKFIPKQSDYLMNLMKEAKTAAEKQAVISRYGIELKVSALASRNPQNTAGVAGFRINDDMTEAQMTAIRGAATSVSLTDSDYDYAWDAAEGANKATIDPADVAAKIQAAVRALPGENQDTVTVSSVRFTTDVTDSTNGKIAVTWTVSKTGYNSETFTTSNITVVAPSDLQLANAMANRIAGITGTRLKATAIGSGDSVTTTSHEVVLSKGSDGTTIKINQAQSKTAVEKAAEKDGIDLSEFSCVINPITTVQTVTGYGDMTDGTATIPFTVKKGSTDSNAITSITISFTKATT